jgi:hypothetical protein
MSNQQLEVTTTNSPDGTRTQPHVRNVAPDQTILLKKEVEGLDTNFYLLEIYPDNPEQYPERYKVTRLNSCNRNNLYTQWTPPGSPPGPNNIVYYEDDPRQGWNVTVCQEQAGGRNKKRKTARKRNRKRNRINKSKIRHESIRRKKTLR